MIILININLLKKVKENNPNSIKNSISKYFNWMLIGLNLKAKQTIID